MYCDTGMSHSVTDWQTDTGSLSTADVGRNPSLSPFHLVPFSTRILSRLVKLCEGVGGGGGVTLLSDSRVGVKLVTHGL